MTSDNDPVLQALFNDARAETIENGFTGQVMSEVERSRRQTLLIWVSAALIGMLVLWWVTGPVLDLVDLIAGLLPKSLFDLGESQIAAFLAPMNSVGTAVAATALGLWVGFRKIFS